MTMRVCLLIKLKLTLLKKKKNIPQNVENRLNMLSCNETVFNQAKPLYQDALRASGYTHELKYKKVDIHSLNKRNVGNRKNRSRRTFWLNPPWDGRVATDVGAKFLRILDTTIPRDQSPTSPHL